MKLSDFYIGLEFFASAGFVWRCTDVGTRTITAIQIEADRDASWYKGPPYLVTETVFDEHDLPGCYLSFDDAIEDAIHEADTSGHPGFPHKVASRMMRERFSSQMAKYRNKGLLRFDRVRGDGELLHPYAAKKSGDSWNVRLYLPFVNEYAEMPELEFLGLPIATNDDVKQRAKANSINS
ncbi:hypothetical protein [Sulfuriferula nivalis]|uniref:Uncharacterized protein n=1 Tax=Sulfuriferula nivalis TaxID=2675298 RepID=A0A809RCC9_9PROT|nr:hypothetical protein [Sulfuriferula nivalis]BBO99304.1 hypothetical protein SFSGTM_00130 [Sulfuriferula nivalis]